MGWLAQLRPLTIFKAADDQQLTSWLFLRLLALVYLSAFLSLAVQIQGLAGREGILPFYEHLQRAYQIDGIGALAHRPTLFWIHAGDAALLGACLLGAGLALLLLFSVWQRTALIVMFLLYLSLHHAGQVFLNFQWDYLLLEAGFLSIFLINGPSKLIVFLFHFLLFRLRFMSGLSKITSGDPLWVNLEAVKFYFETQPLPHVGAWYAHQLPDWLLRAGTGFTLFAELLVPLLIFMPRHFRIFAAVITITLQLAIIATSNHNFINLLTIILCLFLLDDQAVKRLWPRNWRSKTNTNQGTHGRLYGISSSITAMAIFTASLPLAASFFAHWNQPTLMHVSSAIRPFGLGNIYHVFPTMQTERHELEIQGSNDGIQWKTYVLPYKPGPLDRRPAFIIPHQPRLDWMVWFLPARFDRDAIWFNRLMEAISQNRTSVMALFEHNPFPDQPPRHLRVLSWRYHYASSEEHKKTGQWWTRELLGEFPNVPVRRP